MPGCVEAAALLVEGCAEVEGVADFVYRTQSGCGSGARCAGAGVGCVSDDFGIVIKAYNSASVTFQMRSGWTYWNVKRMVITVTKKRIVA